MKKAHLFSSLALWTSIVGMSTTQSYTAQAATPDNTATVNYVSGYGIATWGNVQSNANVTGHYLPTGSQWLVNTTVTGTNGHSWYLVGNNEWASEQYYDLGNENSSQSLDDVVTIKYIPGYSVNVWTAPNASTANGKVPHNGDYKTISRRVVNGKTWYEIGLNQWIQGDYAVIKTEASRGQKVMGASSTTTSNNTSISNQSNQSKNNSNDVPTGHNIVGNPTLPGYEMPDEWYKW